MGFVDSKVAKESWLAFFCSHVTLSKSYGSIDSKGWLSSNQKGAERASWDVLALGVLGDLLGIARESTLKNLDGE
jgi:hypothetical protein